MTFAYYKAGLFMESNENEITVLVIENISMFREIVDSLYNQNKNDDGDIVISSNGKVLSVTKECIVIINPLEINMNSSKIINKVIQDVKEETNEWFYKDYTQLKSSVVEFMELVVGKLDYHVGYDIDMEPTALFKALNIVVDTESDTLIEKLIDYMKIMRRLMGMKLFIFVNLKSYLDVEELVMLYEVANYEKVALLLIESHDSCTIDGEVKYIIDKDNCIIQY